MSKTIPQVPLLEESALKCENYRVKLKGILVEQESEVHVVSVRPELIGDVRNMITGFLENNRMKLTTGSGDNVGRISARRAWIPLKKGKAELMVHEIAVNCVTRIRTNRIVGSRKGGTSTSFGAGSCAYRVCSHKGGTDRRLLGMTGKTVSRRTMCSKQVRVSCKLGRRGWLLEVLAVAAAMHVNLALVAGTDEQSFGGPEDRSSKYSQ